MLTQVPNNEVSSYTFNMQANIDFEDKFKTKDLKNDEIIMHQLPFTKTILFTKAMLDKLEGNSLYFICTARMALESEM